MQEFMILREHDLIDNPSTRLPVCLCLDTSSSMMGAPIEELNRGISYFFQAIEDDEVARYSVELSIVTFDSSVNKILDFAGIERHTPPTLTAYGSTSMGKGIETALDLLEERKENYSSRGVDYYQPWLVLMTDGCPTDYTGNAISRVQDLAQRRKLTLFPVAVGDHANKDTLKSFSTLKNNMILKVSSPKYFREFFEWLSQSISVASQSIPGDKPALPTPSPVIEIEL